jgi:hypothetical protein
MKENPYAAVLAYKYSAKCATCVFLRRHPKEKLILANINRFNNASAMTMLDFQKLYAPSVNYPSIQHHVKTHIRIVKKPTATMIVNENEPEAKKIIEVEAKKAEKEQFERTLDEFIDQFDEGLRSRQFKLTVKDGLTALKIKADIANKNKDRKADVLKALAGARGERSGSPERTET